ncbi:MAG: pilus assembly protein [Sphingomonadaceae bacterium]|nr:pilus assembly protein [Sphingomonadaceae bacterium]
MMSRLARDTGGNMLALGALGLLVTMSLVGGGVDMSRAYKVQSRLQAACDAGVLAGRKAVRTSGFDTNAEDTADSFFNNNFDETEHGASGTSFTVVSPDNGNTVNGSASTGVNSTIMRAFGFNTIDLAVSCSASMGVGNSDVTMVLDTTGSMGSRIGYGGPTKIVMLRDAMKNFYDTVQTATAGGNARIRYAFVPYSSSVNVGRLIYDQDPDYLVDEYTIQSREPVYTTTTVEELAGWEDPVTTTGSGQSGQDLIDYEQIGSDVFTNKNDCLDTLPSDTSWATSGSTSTESDTSVNGSGQQVTTTTVSSTQTRLEYTCVYEKVKVGNKKRWRWVPYEALYQREYYDYTFDTRDPVYTTVETNVFDRFAYKPVTYDVSTFKTFSPVTTPTGNNGSGQTSTWEGCIEERSTIPANGFSYNRIQGITPTAALDLDIDTAPDPFDDDTRWAPMWPNVAWYRTSWVSYGRGGRWEMSNVAESETGEQPSSFCPRAGQLLTTMSESAFDAYADSLYPEGNTYHDIGILWGARVSSPQGIFADNVNEDPSNGGNVSRHLIFMTDGALVTNNSIQTAYGIEFHDRRVTGNGSNNQNSRHNSRFLALCEAVKAKGIRLWVIAFDTGLTNDLESCASSDSAFTANDADELNSAFQEIANEVGELRIVQ